MRPLSAVAFALALSVSTSVHAQTAASQGTPPQTARQALIEMFFGQAPDHLEKHLPDITRRAFQSLQGADGQSALGAFSMLLSKPKGQTRSRPSTPAQRCSPPEVLPTETTTKWT